MTLPNTDENSASWDTHLQKIVSVHYQAK